MTIIAYRSGVMAADTASILGDGTKLSNDKKIIKVMGHLFGLCGSYCPDIAEAADWWLHDSGAMGRWAFTMLVVTPEGRVELVGDDGVFNTITEDYFAIGSGAQCALGAMHAGATARQAAKAAIQWNDSCGGRVMWRRL